MSKVTSETLLIGHHELPGTGAAHRFVGARHGGVPVSLFLVHSDPGARVAPHNIVIAPAQALHQFANTGGEELRLTAIHPASQMSTHWLTPPRREESQDTPASVDDQPRKRGGLR